MEFRQAIWDEPLLVEHSRQGRRSYSLPKQDQKISKDSKYFLDQIPSNMMRPSPPPLPEISEPELVRHFVRLSQMNFAIDVGMYPLGSCTMKYNPKISQRIARNAKIALLHPYQDESTIQGTLEIMYELGEMLSEIAGMARFTLAPAAGAQGEYVGALIIRNYLRDQGLEKDEMLVPDSAHGTNPSSAAMAGFKVVKVPSSEGEGIVSEESVKSVISKRTAGMMLTVPSTLGIFEREIVDVAKLIHEAGGQMYYDGANMNALVGTVRPGDMGFDVVHINVHKTFATPHGGGGPGAGPVGVGPHLVDYLPIPLVTKLSDSYKLDYSVKNSIGYVKSFYGNIAVLLRAYCYILSLGKDGLKAVSEQAVLASNYLMSLLDKDSFNIPYSSNVPRKHEFVVSASPLKKKTGISAGDVAKAILDSGMHSPTTYFPLIVNEALMIEPTETEPVENLERFASIMNKIAKDSLIDKESIITSPRNTAIGRLDEYRASHPSSMILNWKMMQMKKGIQDI